MPKKYNFILLFLILFSVVFTYLSFRTSVVQRLISNDLKNNNRSLTFIKVDSLLNGFPNISPTSLPDDIWRVQYLLAENNFTAAKKYVKSASEINPHVYVSEYLLGLILYTEKKYDSSYFFAKKAFEGWPKNLNHYNSYVDVLEQLQDSVSLVNAFNILDSSLKKRPEYFRRFYSSFNKIKLSYLVINYEDQRNVSVNDIIGRKFIRGYNFPNKQVIIDSTSFYEFKSKKTVENQNEDVFNYEVVNDSIYFYYQRDLKTPIAVYNINFSPSYNTLIFNGIEFEKGKFQNQYYIYRD